MTPQQYERLSELFHAVLEIAPDKRKIFLDQLSDGDVDLRRELESLLAAQRAALHGMVSGSPLGAARPVVTSF